MEWNPQKLQILGIWLTNDLKDCEVLNFCETFFFKGWGGEALCKVWLKDKKQHWQSSCPELTDFI